MMLSQLSIIFGLIVGLGMSGSEVFALTPLPATYSDPMPDGGPTSAYRQVLQVGGIDIIVPTVVEVPLTQVTTGYERPSVLVLEHETGRIVPSYFSEMYSVSPAFIVAEIDYESVHAGYLVDADQTTGTQFDLPPEGEGIANFILRTSGAPVLSSGLTLNLERNVAFPTSIEIRAYDEVSGVERIVLSRTRMTSEQVQFIPTSASVWYILLTYAQPLKINEAKLLQDDLERNVSRSVRFLAQPQSTYSVYYDADRATPSSGESGDLTSNTGVLQVIGTPPTRNSTYIPADVDQDGVQDMYDNCVMTANTNQTDVDTNGRGDACDDFDRDGRMNTEDNCINLPNRDQADEDGDGIGDVCDAEESRFTERLPWVPWAGMGIAGIVIASLFAFVALQPVKPKREIDLEN